MRLLQVVFVILWGFGYLGNGILFLYIEWSFVRQSFIQVFNPFLQLQILRVLLTTPLFWVFLAMALVGHYAVTKIEGYLKQGAKRTKIDSEPVGSPQPLPKPVSEPETGSVEPQIKLLEWAIQSSQKVRFSYEEQNGERSNCTVTPINLKTVEKTLWLEGYSYQRGVKRNFAIKRMRDLKIVPANELNPEAGTSQRAKPTGISFTPVVSPPPPTFKKAQPTPPTPSKPTYLASPQPLPRPVIEHKQGISQEVIARPYISFRISELERITASEWNSVRGLSDIHYELEFRRPRRKAVDLRERIAARLTQLQVTPSPEPTQTAKPGAQNVTVVLLSTSPKGLLKFYGYTVGIDGLPESERRKILDTVFLRPLRKIDNAAYSSEWGEPNSAKRLQKLVEWGEPNSTKRLQKLARSIAAFTRLAKGRGGDFTKAIHDWEADLAYLKRTYYNNRFSFRYPRT